MAQAYPVHPVLTGRRVRIRPGRRRDAERLRAILAEPSVSQWWGAPDLLSVIEDELRDDDEGLLLFMEIGGEVAGGIQYSEEDDPMYRHAGIGIYLGTRFQGPDASTRRSRCWPGTCSSNAATTGSRLIRRPITNGPSAAMPGWASGRSGSCASTSAAPAANSTTAS